MESFQGIFNIATVDLKKKKEKKKRKKKTILLL